jgi:hypothetical protein
MLNVTYVSRLDVALAEDTAMIRCASPSGGPENGALTDLEFSRLIISHRTLRDFAAKLNRHVAMLDEATRKAKDAKATAVKAAMEKRSIGHGDDEKEPRSIQ